jgi:hypothetical protein
MVNVGTFLTIWWKAPFLLAKDQKKDGNLGDSARGQADPRSVAVYTMDRLDPAICMYYSCSMCGNGVPPLRTHKSTCCGLRTNAENILADKKLEKYVMSIGTVVSDPFDFLVLAILSTQIVHNI